MSQFVHIVYVHPVENGEPNLSKVELEEEFECETDATEYVEFCNHHLCMEDEGLKAVYYDATGELV